MSFLGRLRAPRRPSAPQEQQAPPPPSPNSARQNHAYSQQQQQQQQQQQYLQQQHQQQQLQKQQQQQQQQAQAAAIQQGPPPLYLCQPFVKSTVITGNFKTLVTLPKYVDPNEWVGVNLFDFFNNLNHFYGLLSPLITPESCPTMACGPGIDFTWTDHQGKVVKLPAPAYIDYVFSWVQGLLDDENTFPTKNGHDYPPNFASTAKHMYRQLLRVFAHIYHVHFATILHLSLEAHWNALFAHFLAFGREFDILDLRDLRSRDPANQLCVADLYERWREMKILDV